VSVERDMRLWLLLLLAAAHSPFPFSQKCCHKAAKSGATSTSLDPAPAWPYCCACCLTTRDAKLPPPHPGAPSSPLHPCYPLHPPPSTPAAFLPPPPPPTPPTHKLPNTALT
jgi:hypothetical protein